MRARFWFGCAMRGEDFEAAEAKALEDQRTPGRLRESANSLKNLTGSRSRVAELVGVPSGCDCFLGGGGRLVFGARFEQRNEQNQNCRGKNRGLSP